MSKVDTEITELTKLVLYGWGYPALFHKADGTRFQNRLVMFPLHAAPAIEGASKEAFFPILPKLEILKAHHLELLQSKSSGSNPAWVWVNAPEHLSPEEILSHRQQFEAWTESINTKENQLAPAPAQTSWTALLPLWDKIRWTQTAIVVAVLAAITLAMIYA